MGGQIQLIVLVLIIAGSVYMAVKRRRNGETAYAVAWSVCALVNIFYLVAYALPALQ